MILVYAMSMSMARDELSKDTVSALRARYLFQGPVGPKCFVL